jgi:uncharacterized membrane protein YgdD (TMEM256/DUF423 family)
MRSFLLLAATSGFVAVALGAFGAHGLKGKLAALPDAVVRLGWWQTGAQYQLAHALALALVAVLSERSRSAALTVSGWAFVAGTLLFSGSLYVMTLTGARALGAVTPFGGLSFLAGWAALAVFAIRAAL